jgi:hypothetical protein
MSDLELLFLVIAVLYAWECACWLRVGSVGFLTWFGRHWRMASPGTLLGNQQGGFIFAPPLPPLGSLLVGRPIPFSASVRGVAPAFDAGVSPSPTSAFTRWEDIRKIEVLGKKVKVNGRPFLSAASPPGAFEVAGQLQVLQKLPPEKRRDAIDDLLRASLDSKFIQDRWDDFSRRSAPLKLLTNAVFVHLFIFAPLLIWRAGFQRCWLGLLVGLLALTASTAISFRRLHKTFYPEAEDDRFTHFLLILLSPATTSRARDTLTRPLFEKFHPLAIAKVFCAENSFRGFARRALLDLRHPGRATAAVNDPTAQSAEQEARDAWLRSLEKFLRKSGLDEKDLTRPPAPNDESCRSYCPRCETQFTTLEGVCADCGGVALRVFERTAPNAVRPEAAGKKGGNDKPRRSR